MRLFILLFSLLLLPAFASAEEHGGGGEGEAAGPAKIQYMEITPKFVVNLIEPKKF
jgi:flagellar basal body-associated protein FliL